MKKQEERKYGACRYCGQINSEEEYETQEEADEYATLHCDCGQAKLKRQEVEETNRKREEREGVICVAHARIRELFGEEIEKRGLTSVEEELQSLMWQIAVMVYDEKVKSMTLAITPNTKAKISKTASGKLLITRADSA